MLSTKIQIRHVMRKSSSRSQADIQYKGVGLHQLFTHQNPGNLLLRDAEIILQIVKLHHILTLFLSKQPRWSLISSRVLHSWHTWLPMLLQSRRTPWRSPAPAADPILCRQKLSQNAKLPPSPGKYEIKWISSSRKSTTRSQPTATATLDQAAWDAERHNVRDLLAEITSTKDDCKRLEPEQAIQLLMLVGSNDQIFGDPPYYGKPKAMFQNWVFGQNGEHGAWLCCYAQPDRTNKGCPPLRKTTFVTWFLIGAAALWITKIRVAPGLSIGGSRENVIRSRLRAWTEIAVHSHYRYPCNISYATPVDRHALMHLMVYSCKTYWILVEVRIARRRDHVTLSQTSISETLPNTRWKSVTVYNLHCGSVSFSLTRILSSVQYEMGDKSIRRHRSLGYRHRLRIDDTKLFHLACKIPSTSRYVSP